MLDSAGASTSWGLSTKNRWNTSRIIENIGIKR